MSPQKHLVLDEDVHEALSQRRYMTGLPIGHIGNAILRAHIDATVHEHLVGEKLVEMGRISRDEYQIVLEQVDQRMRAKAKPGAVPVQSVGPGRFVSGSWEIVNLFESPVGSFQLLEAWARDARQTPLPQHVHSGDEYIVSLGGRCLIVMSGIAFTVTKGNVFQIPSGATHSAIPMDDECHLLAVVSPAVPEYSAAPSPGKSAPR